MLLVQNRVPDSGRRHLLTHDRYQLARRPILNLRIKAVTCYRTPKVVLTIAKILRPGEPSSGAFQWENARHRLAVRGLILSFSQNETPLSGIRDHRAWNPVAVVNYLCGPTRANLGNKQGASERWRSQASIALPSIRRSRLMPDD